MKKLNILVLVAFVLGLMLPNFSLATTFSQADSLSSPYLFALQGQSDSEGPVNFDLYASFNRVISSSYRSGMGLEKAVMTFYPLNNSATKTCTYDLKANTNDCNLPEYLTTVSPLAQSQAVVKINFASSTNTLEKIKFDLYYATSTNPAGYTFNVGDSKSNDGWGGDSYNQSNDAEMQIYNTTLDAYGNDQTSVDGVNRNIVHLSDTIHQGAHVSVTVKNNYLDWDIDSLPVIDPIGSSNKPNITYKSYLPAKDCFDAIPKKVVSFYYDTLQGDMSDIHYRDMIVSLYDKNTGITQTVTERISANGNADFILPSGIYDIVLKLDSTNVIDEVNENDNIFEGKIDLSTGKNCSTVISKDLPDLIIDSVTLLPTMDSGKSNGGNDGSFNVVIKNIGDTTVTSTFYVSAEVPPYTSKSPQHQQSKLVSGLLLPNSSIEVKMGPLQLPPGQLIKDPARFYVDMDILNFLNTNLIMESNEDNNLYSYNFCDNDSGLVDCKKDGNVLLDDTIETVKTVQPEEWLSGNLKVLRNKVKEQEMEIKYLKNINKDLSKINDSMKEKLNQFMAYGVDDNTQKLGEGERAAVIYSFQKAYGNLPQTEEELSDVIKIANGRWPSMKNKVAEDRAVAKFKEIYKRDANLNNPNDNAAIVVMSYGLRQKAENRKLVSEEQGLKIFNDLFGKAPASTEEWNILQAITYSGATREVIDTDGDGLSDAMEAKLGTDPNKADTDGDGYVDGQEVVNNYSPLGT